MIRDQPWFGVGPGNFGRHYPRYMAPTDFEKVKDPHNFALEIWASCGILALLAFLVTPNDVATGSPIDPEVQVAALDTLGNVLTAFGGTVRVVLGSNPSGGTLAGTVSVTASSGVAFFDTLVISNAGSGYTLVASAPGFGSIVSAPFTVFGAIGTAAR